jgi:hypothetical protein
MFPGSPRALSFRLIPYVSNSSGLTQFTASFTVDCGNKGLTATVFLLLHHSYIKS